MVWSLRRQRTESWNGSNKLNENPLLPGRDRRMKNRVIGTLVLGLATGLSIPAVAQEATRSREVQVEQGKDVKIPSGEKQKIKGVIINRNADSFLLRDLSGGDVQVNLTNITKVEEKKGNPFRRAK